MTELSRPTLVDDPGPLEAILANLSGEICRPLGLLHGEINQLLESRADQISEAERLQAQTLLGICNDLMRLTEQSLDAGPSLNE